MKSTNVKVRSYGFSISVIKFLETLSNRRVYWVISDQLMRSATSIGANLIEAKAASSKRDFIRFYDIALKSANEAKYWISRLGDATDADKFQIKRQLQEAEEIGKMIAASLLTLKNKR